ncbi:Auxin-responsive protein SAUR32 [Spatholobus suberectus]|nr:Auxin-responsive protein SAUR32 [Spatholobus suberectus]
MGLAKRKCKQNMILKAWERCRFLRPHLKLKATSKSLSENDHEKGQIAPHGCFSVHVGPGRQRFVVKTKYVNHPLFMMLLEEAEQEYGFESDGPIWLPCNVDLFYKVLAEMDGEENNIIIHGTRRNFTMAKVFPFVLRSPAPLLCYMNKNHSAYSVMDSKLLRMN